MQLPGYSNDIHCLKLFSILCISFFCTTAFFVFETSGLLHLKCWSSFWPSETVCRSFMRTSNNSAWKLSRSKRPGNQKPWSARLRIGTLFLSNMGIGNFHFSIVVACIGISCESASLQPFTSIDQLCRALNHKNPTFLQQSYFRGKGSVSKAWSVLGQNIGRFRFIGSPTSSTILEDWPATTPRLISMWYNWFIKMASIKG